MEQTLIYDINVAPQESDLTLEKVIQIYQETKILFWDSRGATPGIDCRPQVNTLPKDMPITIIDINSEEGVIMLKTLK